MSEHAVARAASAQTSVADQWGAWWYDARRDYLCIRVSTVSDGGDLDEHRYKIRVWRARHPVAALGYLDRVSRLPWTNPQHLADLLRALVDLGCTGVRLSPQETDR